MSASAHLNLRNDERFFFIFSQLAEKVEQAAHRFHSLIENFSELPQAVADIRQIEHDADILVHEIESRLSFTRVTPLDREDIHSLAGRLDDIVDHIEASADRLLLFRISEPTDHLARFADALARISREVRQSVLALSSQNQEELLAHCRQINLIENEADQILRDSLRYLFSGELDPLDVIKWKDIYDLLEEATDSCEDVADVLETAALKTV